MGTRKTKLQGAKKLKYQKGLFASVDAPKIVNRKGLKKSLKLARNIDTSLIEERFSEKDVKKLVSFYNKVILDGRYIDEVQDNPRKVSKKLGIRISKGLLNDFKFASSLVEDKIGQVSNVAVVAVAVIVIVLECTDVANPGDLVIDRSGLIKL